MKQRILIVDDSPLVREMYCSELKQAGYEVITAEDGYDAINQARTEMPDLIFLDVNMPKINGYQVCRLLKDDPTTKDIPIIIETTRASAFPVEDPRSWSYETGADGFIEKEEVDQVSDIVKKYIKEGEKPRNQQVRRENPIGEMEVMSALSHLLDKQLYEDVTRLNELNEKKSAFVANVSHEFKSPMAIVRGILENMKMGVLGDVTDKQKKSINLAMHTVDRLTQLIKDLLDLSKIEAGKVEFKFENIFMDDLIEDVLETYEIKLKEKNIEVFSDFQSASSQINADRDRLTQVLINLLTNAMNYTPESGKITLRLKDEGSYLLFEIQDNGPGISEDQLNKIFNIFEQGEASRKEGTGLGLSICREIVLRHGGKIWAESTVGDGGLFKILLPKNIENKNQ